MTDPTPNQSASETPEREQVDQRRLISVSRHAKDRIKEREGLGASTGSAFATIRRHKYPKEYAGWAVEANRPMWTSDRLGAAPVPLEILMDELSRIAARESNVWAVICPQNADVHPPRIEDKRL